MGKSVVYCAVVVAALGTRASCLASQTEPIDFQRNVRPILSAKCFHCHGPDESHREADLRLDTPDALESGVIEAGDP
ncbi:MAG: hypothetical protein MUF48_20010, partial [Pirellulaceae bacterium]|nr:hypothetical protein [Pirellulaceae bacterium]